MRQHTLSLYTAVLAFDAENRPTKTWNFKGYVGGTLQPRTLTEAECAAYGVDVRAANAKLLICDSNIEIKTTDRMELGIEKYDVLATNDWWSHIEAILLPARGA